MIQIVSDNFDILIHFQNGLKQTHGMATIISQSSTVNQNCTERLPLPPTPPGLIRRLKQEQFKDIKPYDIKIRYFKCCKKPSMIKEFCSFNVLPLKVLCEQQALLQRAQEESSQSFNNDPTNIMVNGQSLKAKTNVLFTPLLDRTPSDPSAMLSTMI